MGAPESPVGEPAGEEELEFEEGVVYEVELTESEGAHYEHMGETTPPNTGDIDSQTSKELPSDLTGDNLEGGFGEQEAKNGSGDAHGKHVMSAQGKTDPTARTNATAKPAEEKIEGNGGSSEAAHGNHVMEGEDEIVEGEDDLDETITKGQSDSRRVPGQAENGAPRGTGAIDIAAAGKVPMKESTEYQKLVAESNNLKAQNKIFTESLEKYKKMLAETVVFNSNLTHVVKLFLENTTTSEEKRSIIKRFDTEVRSLKESKQLCNKVASELAAKNQSLSESMRGFGKVSGTGSSSLNEQTTYVDKEQTRIIELMTRVENIGKNN